MSSWVHVAGVIRLDAFIGNDTRARAQRREIRKILGKECRWKDSLEIWEDAENHPEKYLPMGSEGSLEVTIHTNPDKNCLAAYTVTIFGDLRDCGYSKEEMEKEYIDWFKQKIDELNKVFGIRQATITATNGYWTVNFACPKGRRQRK